MPAKSVKHNANMGHQNSCVGMEKQQSVEIENAQRLPSFSFFFFHVAISDSVQWLPYLGFVPGPTRTTSKGLMSLLFLHFF